MADPVTALIVIGAAATVGEAYEQYEGAGQKEKEINNQSQQNILNYQQKSLSNLEATKNILDKQVAQSTVRGVNVGMSPSFNAIQRDTLNKDSNSEKNLDLEEGFTQENLDIEKKNVRNTLYAQLFGDVAGVGMSFAKLKG